MPQSQPNPLHTSALSVTRIRCGHTVRILPTSAVSKMHLDIHIKVQTKNRCSQTPDILSNTLTHTPAHTDSSAFPSLEARLWKISSTYCTQHHVIRFRTQHFSLSGCLFHQHLSCYGNTIIVRVESSLDISHWLCPLHTGFLCVVGIAELFFFLRHTGQLLLDTWNTVRKKLPEPCLIILRFFPFMD